MTDSREMVRRVASDAGGMVSLTRTVKLDPAGDGAECAASPPNARADGVDREFLHQLIAQFVEARAMQ
ncbi:MAG: hypothetical protein ACJA1R_002377 [Flavobacteriales bacterium]|jgi:hypothetical protein